LARRRPTQRQKSRKDARPGRVTRIVGRRVLVEDHEGDRVCFLSGQRAVIGDMVDWVEAKGTGGKIVGVQERRNALTRVDFRGKPQVLAANLGGLAVVASTVSPTYRPGLIDRYMVAAGTAGIPMALIVTKADLGGLDDIQADLDWRAEHGVHVLPSVPPEGTGVDAVRDFLNESGVDGPWALVGHSGVGKTSLTQALLPDLDVGPVGEISEHWNQGRHTTTGAWIHRLGSAEIVDSPGIRTFLPDGLTPANVRDHFPGVGRLGCKYRDCLHRPGEEGCTAEQDLEPGLLTRYRRLLNEVVEIDERNRP